MGFRKEKRPLLLRDEDRLQAGTFNTSTAASTSLEPRGVYALETAVTSSGAPIVYTLAVPKPGDQLTVVALDNVSSSQAPFHINAQTSGAFMYATASTAQNMVTLATQGASFKAIALNATEWLVVANNGCTFSTST